MIRAVFFDIDGTLVSFRTHRVPFSLWPVLREMQRNGVKLYIATGRGMDGLAVLQDYPFDGYITLNGQYDCLQDGTVIYENRIPKEDLHVLVHACQSGPFPCGFVTKTGKVFNYRDERVDQIHAITHNDNQPAGDISHIEESCVYQAMTFVSEEEEKELMKQLPHCTSARWHPLFADISPLGGTKVIGMDLFAGRDGFTMEEALAVGDGGNDTAMLKHAGYACAMGNAVEELKQIADYVTADVDHNGIEEAMKHYGLFGKE